MDKKKLIIPLRVQLDSELYGELKARTDNGLINMSEFVRRIIKDYLKRNKKIAKA